MDTEIKLDLNEMEGRANRSLMRLHMLIHEGMSRGLVTDDPLKWLSISDAAEHTANKIEAILGAEKE